MKKIVILGSTGSIGKSLLRIVSKDRNSFKIELLTAHQNYKKLLNQAIKYNVKKVILTDQKIFKQCKKYFDKHNIKLFNNYSNLNKILIRKVDYVMNAIVGLNGLEPTLKIIKHTNNIAIANKESIICAWNLIKRELDQHKTRFKPVDSEHFSIWHALNKSINSKNVKKIFLTASGGPLLNIPNKEKNKIEIKQVLKHPNWNMGKKISIDSATLMNKVFEIIEAKKIFNIKYSQLDIFIHKDSYIHAIVEFKNNMISMIAHKTTMDIPIFNTLYHDKNIKNKISEIDLKKLNSLTFDKVSMESFPVTKIINELPEKASLFETALVTANDQLVHLYINKRIQFKQIAFNLLKIINLKEIKLLKKKYPKNVSEIFKINSYVCSIIKTKLSIK